MAGDWIKMRTDLLTSPKVVRMASALKADRFRIVGGLLSVWCLFDAHSADGFLCGYTLDALDDLAAWPGFSAAMKAVGWLEEEGESLVLPRFEAHNGASAKRRAQDADRKRGVRKTSACDADKKRTREEKRREEDKSIPPLPPEGEKTGDAKPKFDPVESCPPKVSPTVWADWCQHRREIGHPLKPTTCRHQARQLADHHDPNAVIQHSIAQGYTGLFPASVNHDAGQGFNRVRTLSEVDKVKQAIAASEAAAAAAGQALAEDGGTVRETLDGEFWSVG